ncbi:Hpt domain-containing protein [Desulfovibrio litoralis]|uniref:HPt (Histidine-containing phosphotransfer) domain-containing protein n=1 Tax=Desulfovibrio litoralis DSM 11393 TaxID=1121455 RepID=A0A1M7S8V4_9BACT|nr:Hpt domain-containing protein [Desulfovibrio litoralis]SHN54873.1 HPt (histidine-containing phosphotransfer) domain-containing protein [Desulfovibrio litoralis DSM 11393]
MSTLNIDAALKSLGGNKKLLNKVMIKFIDGYEQADKVLLEHLTKGEIAEAERYTHTLKGLAGTIGADDFREQLTTLEAALHAGQSIDDSVTMAKNISPILKQVIEDCRSISQTLA